jgi:hypothetical protein
VFERNLSRLFRALLISMSAPAGGAAWMACSTGPDNPDGSTADASTDATTEEGSSNPFPEGSTTDSYVVWCEAGAPQILGNDGCYAYFWVPCGLPPGDYLLDDAGTINRCDQICKNVNAHDCEIMTDAAVSVLFDSGVTGDAGPPELDAASGDDAASSAIYVVCGCYNGGRKPAGLRLPASRRGSPLARHLGDMAHLEAASVLAFARMHGELRALRAPRSLLAEVTRAMRDERRHARTIARIARRLGGSAPAVRARTFRARSSLAMARENAVEGCVRETFGALVATWQAGHAQDPEVKCAMARIAVDETRHAELSWAVARFLEPKLGAAERRRVLRWRERAVERLYEETRTDPHPGIVSGAGIPRAHDARRLLDGLRESLWST